MSENIYYWIGWVLKWTQFNLFRIFNINFFQYLDGRFVFGLPRQHPVMAHQKFSQFPKKITNVQDLVSLLILRIVAGSLRALIILETEPTPITSLGNNDKFKI